MELLPKQARGCTTEVLPVHSLRNTIHTHTYDLRTNTQGKKASLTHAVLHTTVSLMLVVVVVVMVMMMVRLRIEKSF